MGDRTRASGTVGPLVPLRFRLREPNWWVATDRGEQWSICRHGDGYFHYGWRGVVDGRPESADLGSWYRRADAVSMIEDLRPGIAQRVRDRRAKRVEV